MTLLACPTDPQYSQKFVFAHVHTHTRLPPTPNSPQTLCLLLPLQKNFYSAHLTSTSPHSCFLLCHDPLEGHHSPLSLHFSHMHTIRTLHASMLAWVHKIQCKYMSALCPQAYPCLFSHMHGLGCPPCCGTLAAPGEEVLCPGGTLLPTA